MVTYMHLCKCNLPTCDEVADAERFGISSFPAVVKDFAVYEASLVVYCNHVACTGATVAFAALDYLDKYSL